MLSVRHEFLVLMGLLVRCQIRALGESFVTARICAYIGFFTGVSSQMRSEIEIKGEAFEAQFTFKRLFTCVNKLMPFKLGIIQETLATSFNRANVLALTMSH